MKSIIIQGSARSDGNTFKVNTYLKQILQCDVIDLNKKNILPYDYDHNNTHDDFIPLIKDLVQNYDCLIFSSPVYWYSMSGIMKNFFDRITDCLQIEKETGRQLRGKKLAVLSCSTGPEVNESFYDAFQLSAEYLGMTYTTQVHTWLENGDLNEEIKEKLTLFASKLSL